MAEGGKPKATLGSTAALLLGIGCGLLFVMVAALLASMVDSATDGAVERALAIITSRAGLTTLLAFCVLALSVRAYDHLVRARNQVRQAWAITDAHLKLRANLIPQLVSIVSVCERHEQHTLENAVRSRIAFLCARGPRARGEANQDLTAAIQALITTAERYPQLRTSSDYRALRNQLAEVEDKITWARQLYNKAVVDYNGRLSRFPRKLWVPLFGFTLEESFGAKERECGATSARAA